MSLIHVLDDGTVNKIAAGEVVERPASVIKELVENSIDAGAKRIEVEIMAGGTSFMRVTDDGCGMTTEDAQMAVKRHATSKIREADDLVTIGTLGFRGEALPTIASVSRFSMMTRRAGDELGTSVRITGDGEPQVEETGCRIGTTIRVEDLFFNTPARKKFMKTTHTEGGKISECLTKLALSHPEIAFRFISNNKVSMTTPGTGRLEDAITAVYGTQAGEALLPVGFEDTDVKITGFLTKPSMIRSSRNWQTFIVNDRLVESKSMSKALDNAYHSLLPKAGYPLAVLFIEVPQRSVDVNVHPRKIEIKFEDEGRMFKAVYKSVLDAIRPSGQKLTEVAAVVEHPERHYTMEGMTLNTAPAVPQDFHEERSSGMAQSFSAAVAAGTVAGMEAVAEAQQLVQMERRTENSSYAPTEAAYQEKVAEQPLIDMEMDRQLSMVPIGQVALCYIIAQDPESLYIIDQHAAHERILYDKFSRMADGIPSQQLLVHPIMSFGRQEMELLESHQALLHSLGFDMEAGGPQEVRLKAVPSDIPDSEAETVLRKIVEALLSMHSPTAAEIRHACIATTACRAAIKRGEELNLRQMQIILDELAHTERPYTCPHGRPTILRFESKDLAKMFKRT
ncbi:MAG: DNA mismatch repair endonuclease MutL [Schwartzia succinivorans]|nr:DNA mismatch repair endonuclease MutL [Schwartzia succinivorans]